jgi:hypothetical protein
MIHRLRRGGPILLVALACACGRSVVGPSDNTAGSPVPLDPVGSYGSVPASLAPTLQFMGSTPGNGGHVTFPYGDFLAHDLSLSFVVTTGADSYLTMEVNLLGANGSVCAQGTSPSAYVGLVRGGRPTPFTLSPFMRAGGGPECAFSETGSFTTYRIQVRARFEGSNPLAWAWTGEMQLARTFTWSGPALSPVETVPTITNLRGCVDLNHYGGPGAPRYDDVQVICDAHEPDGDALTFDIRFESENGCGSDWDCWSDSDTIPRRTVDGPLSDTGERTHSSPAPSVRGTATCTVSDTHGHVVQRSVCVSVRGQPCPVDPCFNATR